jgi:hypothetical protein
MRIIEVVSKKPLTPEKARIRSLQQSVNTARNALQRERDRQRKQRERERMQRL